MFISHVHKYIFIHLYKTAGTSIRHALLSREPLIKRLLITAFKKYPIKPFSTRAISFATRYCGYKNFSYKAKVAYESAIKPTHVYKPHTSAQELKSELLSDYSSRRSAVARRIPLAGAPV